MGGRHSLLQTAGVSITISIVGVPAIVAAISESAPSPRPFSAVGDDTFVASQPPRSSGTWCAIKVGRAHKQLGGALSARGPGERTNERRNGCVGSLCPQRIGPAATLQVKRTEGVRRERCVGTRAWCFGNSEPPSDSRSPARPGQRMAGQRSATTPLLKAEKVCHSNNSATRPSIWAGGNRPCRSPPTTNVKHGDHTRTDGRTRHHHYYSPHSRSSSPSLQSPEPSHFQSSRMHLPSLQRKSLSEHSPVVVGDAALAGGWSTEIRTPHEHVI